MWIMQIINMLYFLPIELYRGKFDHMIYIETIPNEIWKFTRFLLLGRRRNKIVKQFQRRGWVAAPCLTAVKTMGQSIPK